VQDSSATEANHAISDVSGQQFDLRFGSYRASIASVGATLRSLSFAGRDLVVPFAADEMRPGFRGASLAPWPNRVADGRYSFAGHNQQLALTEPARGHALHGLACWLNFAPISVTESSVTLRATVEPQTGYPHRLELTVTFLLTDAGLSTELAAVNVGSDAAPFGAGFHPYLRAGNSPLEEWSLQLDASQVLVMEPTRMLPLTVESVDHVTTGTGTGTGLDFRTPVVINEMKLDHPFTALGPFTNPDALTGAGSGGGMAFALLLERNGSGVQVSWDARCPWVQVFTDDQAAGVIGRQGVAIEPVSCPPDAFNSGTDLQVIQAGQQSSVGYTITAVTA
jgi:aldose 1-epimerase